MSELDLPVPLSLWPSSLIVSGHGATWTADFDWPVLVRIDPATREGRLFASYEALAVELDPYGRPRRSGPTDLEAGLDALWMAVRKGRRIIRVDPSDGGMRECELPFSPTEIAAGAEGLFAIGQPGTEQLPGSRRLR